MITAAEAVPPESDSASDVVVLPVIGFPGPHDD